MIPPFGGVATLEDLQEQCRAMRGYTPEYYTKQIHAIPMAPVVDRVQYIVEACRDKHVLHLGCSWPPSPLHAALEKSARRVYGMDIEVPVDVASPHFLHADLDTDPYEVLQYGIEDFDLVVCAEILEHLGNPGHVLKALRCGGHMPVLITVPNAYARAGRYAVSGGIENVNRQHVAYYSYWTLHELVTRHGYVIEDFCWYNQPKNGQPQESEGLIFLMR